jgi:hypothetical protein
MACGRNRGLTMRVSVVETSGLKTEAQILRTNVVFIMPGIPLEITST